MIHCWAIGRKVVQVAHRTVHRAIRRVRHYYHSPAVKIIAPAIVCISTGAGLTPWLASAPPLFGQGPPAGLFSSSAAPVGGGIFVGPHPSDIPLIPTTMPPELFKFPLELATLNLNELVPSMNESSITAPSSAPSQSSQSVPEPSTALLFGAALALITIARHAFPGGSFSRTGRAARLGPCPPGRSSRMRRPRS